MYCLIYSKIIGECTTDHDISLFCLKGQVFAKGGQEVADSPSTVQELAGTPDQPPSRRASIAHCSGQTDDCHQQFASVLSASTNIFSIVTQEAEVKAMLGQWPGMGNVESMV